MYESCMYRGILEKLNIRFAWAWCPDLVKVGAFRHGEDAASAHLLGRCLCAAAVLVPLLGDDERWVIRWEYTGVLRSILVEFGHRGDIRGIINPCDLVDYAATEADVFGEEPGKVFVTQSTSQKVLHSGVSEAPLGDPVRDLEYFLCISHQIETGLVAMIGFSGDEEQPVEIAQSFMIQALPDCDLEILDRLRQKLQSPEFRRFLRRVPDCDNYLEKMLHCLLQDEVAKEDGAYSIYEGVKPVWQCLCNRQQIGKALAAIPPDEQKRMLANGESVRVRCEFCGENYEFGPDALRELWRVDEP